MKKPKRWKLVALIAAVVLVLGGIVLWWSLWGPGAKVTVYVRVVQRSYDAHGVEWSQLRYEYDDHGRLLSQELDRGPDSQVWDDQRGIYQTQYGQVDGTIETSLTFTYDDRGNITSSREEATWDDEAKQRGYDWSYDGDVPEKLVVDYGGDIAPREVLLRCDEGRVEEIYSVTSEGYEMIAVRARYDDQGRLTREILITMEQEIRYDYEYDSKGCLIQVERLCRGTMFYVDNTLEWEKVHTVVYSYDSKGRLTQVERTEADGQQSYLAEYSYDGGTLQSKTIQEGDREQTYTYSYDGKRLEQAEHTYIDETGRERWEELHYDREGNLTKIASDDGSCVCYEYEALQLSKEEAARYQLQQQVLEEVGADGLSRTTYFLPYCYQIPTPVSPEWLTDPSTK